jgi:3-phosphoshikimate 1-carboxyvinyltransferase
MKALSQLSAALRGTVRAPGDKSISHRAMIFGAMAEGVTTVDGLLEGDDIMATAQAMRDFGAEITKRDDGQWHVTGLGEAGFKTPSNEIDCGNAGTGVRLIMGAAAGYSVTATYIGDASLSSRPMGRVLNPLSEMGVKPVSQEGGRLPATLSVPDGLTAIDYTPPHASAQVKSCLLLAGLNAKGTTSVTEPTLTRDHTENMLRAFGAKVESQTRSVAGREGQTVKIAGGQKLRATHIDVPGDPSSAAFIIVAALITPGSDVVVENVMMNPTRTGLFETLIEMGGFIRMDNYRTSGGEVIADISVKHSKLTGIVVPPQRAPSMIDEYPILAVASAFAKGRTVMDGIGELRVKESDRIAATEALLKANGVEVSSTETGMTVIGGAGAEVRGGGLVTTHHDHRIAMSALILGLQAAAPVSIDDASMIATSFPSFFDLMDGLGAKIELGS